ncbi:MAG: TIGR01244 family sulfur transferase [Geminicoccaceae bacterium]
MGDFRKLTESVYVAPQLVQGDFVEARRLGIATIVNNRPDGEAPGQLTDGEARQAAEAAGMAYHCLPISPGGFGPDQVNRMAALLAEGPSPVLAYCRSGTRSTILWAFACAGRTPVDALIAAAAHQGYDLVPYRATLESLAKDRAGA